MAASLKCAIVTMFTLCSCSESARFRLAGHTASDYDDINTYAEFAQIYRSNIAVGSNEYKMRAEIFQKSLKLVRAQNSQPHATWRAKINRFADFTNDDKQEMFGLVRRFKSESNILSSTSMKKYTGGDKGGLTINDGPPVRDQGACGSCWALAAVAVIEGQLLFNSSNQWRVVPQFSAQALVDCAQNPDQCGGTGGCDGATFDVAYKYVASRGLLAENAWPYKAHEQTCPDFSAVPSQAWVHIGGHVTIQNQYDAVMNMLTGHGPVAVGIAASDFMSYDHGIFHCNSRDVVINHGVMLKGFGVENGVKYWLVQNSWSVWWGERGHIRIFKREDEDKFCGWDYKPEEGFACKDDTASYVAVCGSCGILSRVSQPFDVTVADGDN